ncbi:hypothetical protein SAMN05428952_10915 [Nitrosomonas sp. Nm132]|nr:hypothetical protein SAMN05428952_10915 [Nitrosomonas sp. Nm132]
MTRLMQKQFSEAVTRPNMRFVSIKNVEQQAILSVHRARQGFVRARTAQANQIRGLYSLSLVSSSLRASNRLANVCLTFWKMPKMVFQE